MIKSVFDAFILSPFLFIQMLTSHTQFSRSEMMFCSRTVSYIEVVFFVHGQLPMHEGQLLVG